MNKNTVVEFTDRQETADPLTELLRRGARELLQNAMEAELLAFMEEFRGRLDDDRATAVRNGFLPESEVQTGIGPVKVRNKDGEPVTFRSALVPPHQNSCTQLLRWNFNSFHHLTRPIATLHCIAKMVKSREFKHLNRWMTPTLTINKASKEPAVTPSYACRFWAFLYPVKLENTASPGL